MVDAESLIELHGVQVGFAVKTANLHAESRHVDYFMIPLFRRLPFGMPRLSNL
jgi:hypothetical protein